MSCLIYLSIPVLMMVTHEGSHMLMAKALTGTWISFYFQLGHLWKMPIPRGIWYMPNTDSWKQKVIAAAGFTGEFLFAALLFWNTLFQLVYLVGATIHLVSYKFYAGESSDFKWFK